jgi:hypothetical protein
MIRNFARFACLILGGAIASACSYGAPFSAAPEFRPFPGQGQYIRPAYLGPQPTPIVPAIDVCRSQLYAGLVGRHEGAIYIPGLPGRKRIIKPANLEGFGYSPNDSFYTQPPFVQVTEFLTSQSLYAPAISNMTDRLNLGPEVAERLTIELDANGYVQQVGCS